MDEQRSWRASPIGRFFWQFVVTALAMSSGWIIWWFKS